MSDIPPSVIEELTVDLGCLLAALHVVAFDRQALGDEELYALGECRMRMGNFLSAIDEVVLRVEPTEGRRSV